MRITYCGCPSDPGAPLLALIPLSFKEPVILCEMLENPAEKLGSVICCLILQMKTKKVTWPELGSEV
jgi:hypothetical protein